MPRKATAADSDNTVKEELPTCSGAHLEFAQWLRDLLHYSYLFEADVAFFLASGSSVIVAWLKLAVCASAPHSETPRSQLSLVAEAERVGSAYTAVR